MRSTDVITQLQTTTILKLLRMMEVVSTQLRAVQIRQHVTTTYTQPLTMEVVSSKAVLAV